MTLQCCITGIIGIKCFSVSLLILLDQHKASGYVNNNNNNKNAIEGNLPCVLVSY